MLSLINLFNSNKIRIVFIPTLIFVNFLESRPAIGVEQICKILYFNKTSDVKILKNYNDMVSKNNLIDKPCKQIGVEYNEAGEADINKPIFACCTSSGLTLDQYD